MSRKRIKLATNQIELTAVLFETATADLLWSTLPIETTANTWGDEIYFGTHIKAPEEMMEATVDLGAVGYWPPGQAICFFFGPTPISQGEEIRPASPVNVIGEIEGDPTVLQQVNDGDTLSIEKL